MSAVALRHGPAPRFPLRFWISHCARYIDYFALKLTPACSPTLQPLQRLVQRLLTWCHSPSPPRSLPALNPSPDSQQKHSSAVGCSKHLESLQVLVSRALRSRPRVSAAREHATRARALFWCATGFVYRPIQ
jgi:hypothetical protein